MFDLENRLSLGFSFSDAKQVKRRALCSRVNVRVCPRAAINIHTDLAQVVRVSLRAGWREHVLMELLQRLEGEQGYRCKRLRRWDVMGKPC